MVGKPVAFIPGDKYPSISITGFSCSLNCKYCMGRYLYGMIPAPTPEKLYTVIKQLYLENRVNGVLISGGFTRNGYLPVENHLPVIKRIKNEINLTLSIHPGFINIELMNGLRESGVDIVDYEFILDDYILRELKNLDITSRQVIEHYEEILTHGPKHVVPHIPIGFTSDDSWIYRSIDTLTSYNPEIVVFLISMDADASIRDRVVKMFKYARTRLNSEISLGCMRPFSLKPVIDKILIEEELIDRIANPLRIHVVKYGLETRYTCCSIPWSILSKMR